MDRSLVRLIAALAPLAAACTSAPPPAPSPTPAQLVAQADAAARAKARADSARLPYVEADIQFMQGMIRHHAQAILMARWAPTHEAGPAVQRLAARIINAQLDEIAIMQRWLRDRALPVPEAVPGPMKMRMPDGTVHEMLMPGMLTDAQLAELDAARGAAFDRLFLERMIRHHQGAVGMVKDLFGSYGAGQDETVFKFASDVNVDQTTEIERMKQLLAIVTLTGSSP